MKTTRARLVAAAAVTTLGAGVAVLPAIGFGAGSTTLTATATTTTPTATTTTGTAAAKKARADHSARRAEYEKALAAELGIDVAKLKAAENAAQEKVFLANLDQMVTDGALTSAEATTLRDAAAKGTLRAAVKELRLAKLKTQLDQAVTNGRLTQTEADRILTDARQRSADDDGGLGFGLGRGGDGPGGHRGGPFGGGPRP
jgi:polyhydroxyalkanoate synthesis regulator phasin